MLRLPPGVRKHRAPKGALRPWSGTSDTAPPAWVRKHRAPKGALRPADHRDFNRLTFTRQKAPSAKRCIKTNQRRTQHVAGHRQKAPSAKRCIKTPSMSSPHGWLFRCQKAPSAKRCIKTVLGGGCAVYYRRVRKHRAPKGALRRASRNSQKLTCNQSESTERQKVH